MHGIFPLSRAARLQTHGIEVSYIAMIAGAAWLLEPMFYWRDELGPLHEAPLPSDR